VLQHTLHALTGDQVSEDVLVLLHPGVSHLQGIVDSCERAPMGVSDGGRHGHGPHRVDPQDPYLVPCLVHVPPDRGKCIDRRLPS
jgi:hypothetical protein